MSPAAQQLLVLGYYLRRGHRVVEAIVSDVDSAEYGYEDAGMRIDILRGLLMVGPAPLAEPAYTLLNDLLERLWTRLEEILRSDPTLERGHWSAVTAIVDYLQRDDPAAVIAADMQEEPKPPRILLLQEAYALFAQEGSLSRAGEEQIVWHLAMVALKERVEVVGGDFGILMAGGPW